MTEKEVAEKLLDPKYFIETFVWIVDKNRVKVPFILNPAQSKYYSNRTKADLILKARKEGFSSLLEAMWLHACMFEENTRAVILSQELEATKRHFDRVKFYLDTMGDGENKFVVELDEDSQKQLKFPKTNSSFWLGTAGSRSFGRGDDITHLHLSEVAFYENQDVLTSTLEACVPNAYKVMETTANGVGEMFYSLWKSALDPQNGSPWKTHFFSWFEDPTNSIKPPINFKINENEKRLKKEFNLRDDQIYWYRSKRASMADKSLMPQEYPSTPDEAFISSGRHVFDLSKLKIMRDRLKIVNPLHIGDIVDDNSKISIVDNPEGCLKVWKMPHHSRKYVLVADVAEGVPNGNYSVGSMVDRASWEIVSTMRLRINPGEWGRMLVDYAQYYNNAIIIPESNSIGQGTIEAIKEEQYPHLFKTSDIWDYKEIAKEGFPTNEKNRMLAISALRTCIDEETLIINDPVFIGELETFVQNEKTGKFEALKGCQDDCVMSMAIAAYCLKFLTIDETYSESKKPKILTHGTIVNKSNNIRRRATGY